MVFEPTLHDIDELIVAFRVRGHEEEAGVNQEPQCVVDDSFHDFAVEKFDTHPDAVNDGRWRVKLEGIVIAVSFTVVDVEDGLGVGSGDFLNGV